MAFPSYIGSGAYHRIAGDQTLVLPYPSGIQAGDALFIQVGHNNSPNQTAATYTFDASFSSVVTHTQQQTRQFIYKKLATGSESGSVNVTVSAGYNVANHQGVMHLFRGQDSEITIESLSFSGNPTTDTVIATATLTTTGAERLALQFLAISADQAPSDFSGETGADYAIVTQSGAGSARLSLQTGQVAVAGVVSGGSFTLAATSAAITTGFALIPAPSGGQSMARRVLSSLSYAGRRRRLI